MYKIYISRYCLFRLSAHHWRFPYWNSSMTYIYIMYCFLYQYRHVLRNEYIIGTYCFDFESASHSLKLWKAALSLTLYIIFLSLSQLKLFVIWLTIRRYRRQDFKGMSDWLIEFEVGIEWVISFQYSVVETLDVLLIPI